ncbi:MAG: WecB/TagA/CpsF family glycosyltransferase [Acidobacteria bacterium]|nr:WecB/TagA/CpsF family glycosyltransferase [Acidobacteriota bacterium]
MIAGIHLDNLSEDETLAKIGALIAQGGAHYMAVVNAAKIVSAQNNEQLFGILNSADIVTADGMSVVWASRWLGQPLKERVTGIDMFERLIEYAAAHELSVYFLGAREAVVKTLAELFSARFPQLRLAGFHHGYFDAQENAERVGQIRQSRADLLFVAMGSPAQEKWIAANLQASGVKFALGVGGSFDHLAGFARRAPRWMQSVGLEWLHRLWLEPRRLWRRYLIGNTRFIWLVLKQKLGSTKAKGKS